MPTINFEWKRYFETSGNACVFKDGASYDDIKQGVLGDCYFLACLSMLAEVPERIYARFLTKEKNACGIYAMLFFVNGIETAVFVDDYFPVS